jgi:hypothetical protein
MNTGKKAKNRGKKVEKGSGAMRKKVTFFGGRLCKTGGITPTVRASNPFKNIAYLCIIMIKKFNIVASHISYGATQESPSYEMGISKYAQMRKDRMKEQKIEMMSEAYKRAERSEDAMEMLMPIVKRG